MKDFSDEKMLETLMLIAVLAENLAKQFVMVQELGKVKAGDKNETV